MKSFKFVDFKKIKQTSKMLTIKGIYGLRNDLMIEDDINLKE